MDGQRCRGQSLRISRTREEADLQRLSEGCSPEESLRKSLQFLLEHQPNISILSSFDLSLIRRYFPEYQEEIRSLFG